MNLAARCLCAGFLLLLNTPSDGQGLRTLGHVQYAYSFTDEHLQQSFEKD